MAVVVGPYAQNVQNLIATFDQGLVPDLVTIQTIIDAYENVKNSVAIPATDLKPTIPPEPTANG